jgi:hypothetical protein
LGGGKESNCVVKWRFIVFCVASIVIN